MCSTEDDSSNSVEDDYDLKMAVNYFEMKEDLEKVRSGSFMCL